MTTELKDMPEGKEAKGELFDDHMELFFRIGHALLDCHDDDTVVMEGELKDKVTGEIQPIKITIEENA